MKINSKTYAQSLTEALEIESDLKKIASNFLEVLSKNKQEKKLKEILNLLDEEYAKNQGLILAKIYSGESLDSQELLSIKTKLEKRFNKKIFVKNIEREENLAGVSVEIEGKIYDYSLSGTMENFKKQLMK